MHDRDERLSVSDASCSSLPRAFARSPSQGEASTARYASQSRKQSSTGPTPSTPSTTKQIAEFDAAASGIGDDEFSDCMHQATFEGWEGRKAGTAAEFIAIVIRRLKNRQRH